MLSQYLAGRESLGRRPSNPTEITLVDDLSVSPAIVARDLVDLVGRLRARAIMRELAAALEEVGC